MSDRKIKFRIWDNIKNRWVNSDRRLDGVIYNDPLYIDTDGDLWTLNDLDGRMESVENHTIQQFTGILTNKNEELYEGDVVEYTPDMNSNTNRIGIIEFSDYYMGWSIRDTECYPISDYGVISLADPYMAFNHLKIIGNVLNWKKS